MEIGQRLNALQVVAESLRVVAGQDLLVHVVEELATTVLVDDFKGPCGGVDQVPVPVMAVHAYILPEVRQPVFVLDVRGRVVTGNGHGDSVTALPKH